jgi:nucleoside-diphosphate-sugar epimerase
MKYSAGCNCLITGSTGFVGSNLVVRLIDEGFFVHIIIRKESKLNLLDKVIDKVKIYYYDESIDSLLSVMKKVKPEIVFHLASLFVSEHKKVDIYRLINSNLLFGTQLLEAMRENGVKKIVNTGTSWQHYNSDNYNPVNLYAATKQAFEDILKFYIEAYDMQAITLKLFDTYGPNDPRKKIIHLLMEAARTGKVLEMSPGEQVIDLMYIDDVIDHYIIALDIIYKKNCKYNKTYAVASDQPVTLKALVKLIAEVTESKLNIKWGERSYREREVMSIWKGNNMPNFQAKIDLKSGIKKCYYES